jgi:hypothetical protein
VRPPADGDALEVRLIEWRRLDGRGRDRLLQLDRGFRARTEADRSVLADRWALVSGLPPEEKAGLRRLGARLTEIDARRLEKVGADLGAIARAPRAERAARWRQNPFVRTLTGQELASGEKLLLLL